MRTQEKFFLLKQTTITSLLLLVLGVSLIVGIVYGNSVGRQHTAIALTSSQDKVPIVNHADYILLDRRITADEVASPSYNNQWLPYQGQGLLGFGETNEMWLRFSAKTEQLNRDGWWLVISWPVLPHAQLSVLNHDTQQWQHYPPIGIAHPSDNKIIQDRNIVYPINFATGGEQTFYLNIGSQSLLSVPIHFWRGDTFLKWSHIDLMIVGAVLGALIIMMLYNLSLSILLKDQVYWYYCAYVGAVILYLTSAMGIGSYYLWPNSIWLNKYAVYLSSIASFFSATLFVRQFLRLADHGGWLLSGNNFLLFLWITLGFAVFAAPTDIVELSLNMSTFISTIIAIATGATLWKRNFPTAKIFVVSWSTLIVGTVIFVLALQGALPFNAFTRYSQMAGFSVELVLLSIALAYRINLEITEREAAQGEALLLTKKVSEERRERLKAQMETLNMQRQLNEELESHVVERTEQLNDAMEKLENANAELTKLSVTDPLTKVHNRRYFDDTLISEYKRALRTQQSLAIIMVDIDHFKNINDDHGHDVGDQCILKVAETLKNVIHRPGDLVARYGGEEFVYVLPGSSEEDALIVAEHARGAVEALEIKVNDMRISMTISAGVAAWVPVEDHAYKQLLNAADGALYRAKNSGRNCARAATERGKLVGL